MSDLPFSNLKNNCADIIYQDKNMLLGAVKPVLANRLDKFLIAITIPDYCTVYRYFDDLKYINDNIGMLGALLFTQYNKNKAGESIIKYKSKG